MEGLFGKIMKVVKKNNMNKLQVQEKFEELCNTPSDINEHLRTLKEYADRCETVTEFGVRSCVSTYAFLASSAKKVTSYDILDVAVPTVDKFTFICADDLEVVIEQTDMLFIDTLHQYNQMKQELALHSGKINKFIAAHYTKIFGRNSDDGTVGGLMDALEEFLAANKEWRICYHTDNNNGLTIIERI